MGRKAHGVVGTKWYDPQPLSLLGKLRALISLGRIPLASEVPMWTLLGCILSYKLFPASVPSNSNFTSPSDYDPPSGTKYSGRYVGFDWITALQCMLVTWGTNVSINYANEYFDWDLDRPGQKEAIERDIKRREEAVAPVTTEGGNVPRSTSTGSAPKVVEAPATAIANQAQLNEKIMGNTTRIIHDGTFPPWIALLLGAGVQGSLVLLMFTSRSNDPELSGDISGRSTPYKGAALWIGIISTILSHEYIAPPLRLHYRGWGELISAVLLSPASVLWGMAGYYTATHSALQLDDLVPTISTTHAFNDPLGSFRFIIDRHLLSFFIAIYLLEQPRILIMHIPDIEADTRGGKTTLVVRIGYRAASWAYVLLNIAGLSVLFVLLNNARHGEAGLVSRVAGSGGWKLIAGWSVILSYVLPIMVLTAVSLFAHVPSPGRTGSQKGKTPKGGMIPVLPLTEPPKLVSLQVLTTPLVLSLFLGAF